MDLEESTFVMASQLWRHMSKHFVPETKTQSLTKSHLWEAKILWDVKEMSIVGKGSTSLLPSGSFSLLSSYPKIIQVLFFFIATTTTSYTVEVSSDAVQSCIYSSSID